MKEQNLNEKIEFLRRLEKRSEKQKADDFKKAVKLSMIHRAVDKMAGANYEVRKTI